MKDSAPWYFMEFVWFLQCTVIASVQHQFFSFLLETVSVHCKARTLGFIHYLNKTQASHP